MLYKVSALVLIISIAGTSTALAEYHWLQDSTLKVTVETKEIIYEWEFENPDLYEYEEGNLIWRGDQAKDSFEELLAMLDLSRPTLSEEAIKKITDNYEHAERVTVKRVDLNHCMQTWVWNKT